MPVVLPDPVDPGGYLVAGEPAPQRTSDWMRALVAVLTFVATHDTLPVSTVFTAAPGDDRDTMARIHPVARTLDAYPSLTAIGARAAGWVVLNPPGIEPTPDLDEPDSHPIATGSLLLPGIPDVGLHHRAAWAAVDTTGLIAHMRFTAHAQGTETVDLAVLAALVG